MTTATGRGHGKVLLCGEHAVVHGHPAIATAVDRCTEVTLARDPGPLKIHSVHSDPRLIRAIRQVLPPNAGDVTIQSDLPVGRGMGSSAALAVALVRARAARDAVRLDAEATYDAAMPIERVFHGDPSGVDVAVSAMGGCLWFTRATDRDTAPTRQPLTPAAGSLVILDSGGAGDTAALVAAVSARRPGIDPVLREIGALVHEARTHLGDPEALGPLLSTNHRLLQRLGVSTPTLDGLVALAEGAGAFGAKLSGAGGGGIVIALCRDPTPILGAARAAGVIAIGCVPWAP